MINYLSKFNCLSIKLITCQNKLIADQRMIDYRGQSPSITATAEVWRKSGHWAQRLLGSRSIASVRIWNKASTEAKETYSQIHTADADETKLSSLVASASAVCIGLKVNFTD